MKEKWFPKKLAVALVAVSVGLTAQDSNAISYPISEEWLKTWGEYIDPLKDVCPADSDLYDNQQDLIYENLPKAIGVRMVDYDSKRRVLVTTDRDGKKEAVTKFEDIINEGGEDARIYRVEIGEVVIIPRETRFRATEVLWEGECLPQEAAPER